MRYNPNLIKEGKNPLIVDSKEPSIKLEDYIYNENRYRRLKNTEPELAEMLLKEQEEEIKKRWRYYSHMAKMPMED